MCAQIYMTQVTDQTPHLRFIQLEMSWVIANLAYSNENDINIMFQQQYGLINFFNRVLEGADLQMIDQVLWIISNTACESV